MAQAIIYFLRYFKVVGLNNNAAGAMAFDKTQTRANGARFPVGLAATQKTTIAAMHGKPYARRLPDSVIPESNFRKCL